MVRLRVLMPVAVMQVGIAKPVRECRRKLRSLLVSQGRSGTRSGASDPPKPSKRPAHCDECEAGTRGEVKQPHKQQRIGDAEEQFRNQGAGNKQERRPNGPARRRRLCVSLLIIRIASGTPRRRSILDLRLCF
jgi:hypothetical protein